MIERSTSTGNRRFVIMGLPRSGTTYLMSLLNSHPRIGCAGELFNPYSIVEFGEPHRDRADVVERDRTPRIHYQDFFARHADDPELDRIGFKFMLGHNMRVFDTIAEDDQLSLIYVYRRNRLAQVASLVKATQTKNWAQDKADSHIEKRIQVAPGYINQRWHELAMMDQLFAHWLGTIPHHQISLSYTALFKPGFEQKICAFLGIPYDPGMKSDLVKQGSNRIIDRFENPEPIERYMKTVGFEHWLDEEI